MSDQTPESPQPGSGDEPDQPGRGQQPSYGPPPPYGQAGYGPPPPYGQGSYGTYDYPQGPKTNGKAVAALVTGIASVVLSMCCLGLAGVVAIGLGFKARSEIAASGGTQDGEGLALGGIITGALGVLASLGVILFIIIAVATGNTEFNVNTDPNSPPF